MKVKEIRELNDEELAEKLKELKEELFNLRFQAATGQLENVMRIKEVRRSIARVKTVQRERALSQGHGVKGGG
ncbi:MAG: 50S ribosomal protein L29 [Firmicutes bacterium]|jgi:large subunit ribosomal protein L29|nr:50S ribosomal protein L29 [Bacillota bacterium]HPU01508.1 50S ribosomal protein L29 [Bacillota bacterium]